MADKYRGVLLIGGSSRRMGRPKHLMPIFGVPAMIHLGRLLQAVTRKEPIIVGDGDIPDGCKWPRVEDREKGEGPLSGLLGFWDVFPDRHVLLLATDMPAMTHDALHWLISSAKKTELPVCRPKFNDRPYGEPLAAVYQVSIREDFEKAWKQGARGIHRVVSAEKLIEPIVPQAHQKAFMGANTPTEWLSLIGN